MHPLAARRFGNSIGLSLDEPPLLACDGEAPLEADAVYSLRAGLLDHTNGGAVVSAIVQVTEHGPELLWPPGGLS